MKLETWFYKQSLELYPKPVREQFGSAMLETYSDGLKAAKLEGKTFGFHWNTVLDTVKSVARATAEVKNANPVARVTAVLGVVLLWLLVFTVMRFSWNQTWYTALILIGALFQFGIARFAHHFYQTKYQKMLAAMSASVGIALFVTLIPLFLKNPYPYEYIYFSDPQTFPLSYLQNFPSIDLRIVVLGYISRFIWIIPAALFVIFSVLDTIEKRRIVPMNKYNYTFLVFAVLGFVVDPRLEFLPFRIVLLGGFAFAVLMSFFMCLRLWQLPRASSRLVHVNE
jgi:hypothetical protein